MTTDGFLHPNALLLERNLMERKGFPESYDTRRLLRFLRELKSGAEEVRAPVYSHVVYDIVEGAEVIVKRPDILILEGLNVLQVSGEKAEFVSDYFDFSIYIDADEADIMEWYVERFFTLRETVFKDPTASSATSPREQRRGASDGRDDLDHHQRAQPQREHPADPFGGLPR